MRQQYAAEYQATKGNRNPNLVPANTINKLKGVYKTGDGDTPVFYRPGSLDFLKCKSLGLKC